MITLLPENDQKRKVFSILVSTILAGLITIWGIYGIGEYGIALFILTPLYIGISTTVIYGLKKGITKKQSAQYSFTSLAILIICLFIFAIEGLICILMVLPLAILLTWLGSYIGYLFIDNGKVNNITVLLFSFCLIPLTAFIEHKKSPSLSSVVTFVDIDASPEKVWQNVVEFPELDEPHELLFRSGISYPINANITGKGVGEIRYCNFTTGSFVEPITAWKENELLKFEVLEQPAPMKELSFWDIDAPHLHDYFVSKEGQFKLTQLDNGKTRLEGTTWYYHNIKPAIYWKIWSNYIIHKIHIRVLTHIKKNSERE
ncbi:MAG: hypothetical protein ACI35V_09345 [Sphingobacterium composti]